jgi:histidinol-phosphatase (PHP family)
MYNLCVEFKDFDILGHYDYVARYSPYSEEDRDITLKKYGDYIEAILKYLVENGKTFEINTKTYTNHAGYIPKLDLNILKRFKELGGKYVSVGSDAHYAEHLSADIDMAYSAALEAGFDSITFFQKRTPMEMKIEMED